MKGNIKMIIELKTVQKPKLFKSYDDLFLYLTKLENMKMLVPNPDFKTMNWSFCLHSADRVRLLFEHMKEDPLPIKEAYEQGLPLIEICSGDFDRPEYVVKTPVLNMSYLKKKWALEYCECHGLIIMEKP